MKSNTNVNESNNKVTRGYHPAENHKVMNSTYNYLVKKATLNGCVAAATN